MERRQIRVCRKEDENGKMKLIRVRRKEDEDTEDEYSERKEIRVCRKEDMRMWRTGKKKDSLSTIRARIREEG